MYSEASLFSSGVSSPLTCGVYSIVSHQYSYDVVIHSMICPVVVVGQVEKVLETWEYRNHTVTHIGWCVRRVQWCVEGAGSQHYRSIATNCLQMGKKAKPLSAWGEEKRCFIFPFFFSNLSLTWHRMATTLFHQSPTPPFPPFPAQCHPKEHCHFLRKCRTKWQSYFYSLPFILPIDFNLWSFSFSVSL